MVKRVVWTKTAANQRKEILKFWADKNRNKNYSKKISGMIKNRISYIIKFNYMGKKTDFDDIRVTATGHFSIFYKILEDQIIIMSFWDNRQKPDKLIEILK